MMTVREAHEAMELERTRAILEGLTRAEIVHLVTQRIVPEDAESFAVLGAGLSLEALKFLSARTLIRMKIDTDPHHDDCQ